MTKMTCMCLKTWPFQTPMEDANQSRSSNTHKSGSTRKTQLIRQGRSKCTVTGKWLLYSCKMIPLPCSRKGNKNEAECTCALPGDSCSFITCLSVK